MPAEREVRAEPASGWRGVHASAVAVRGRGLLLVGPSRSGKSRLALALIAASRPGRPIILVGDDRIQLAAHPDGVTARPHPRIAGFIERRGLGIVALRHRTEAPLAAAVVLGATGTGDFGLTGLPILVLAGLEDAAEASAAVLCWWDALPGREIAPSSETQSRHR